MVVMIDNSIIEEDIISIIFCELDKLFYFFFIFFKKLFKNWGNYNIFL